MRQSLLPTKVTPLLIILSVVMAMTISSLWISFRITNQDFRITLGRVPKGSSFSMMLFSPQKEFRIRTDGRIGFENQLRIQRVDDVCENGYDGATLSGPVWWKRHFHVSEKQKLLYCHVPKVASTTFLRYLIKVNDPTLDDEFVDNFNIRNETWELSLESIKRLSGYPTEEALAILATYRKVTWVRNPLQRLVSAWKDKLTTENSYFNKRHGSKIIAKIRVNATAEEIERGYPVTLEEFFLYLLSYEDKNTPFDAHWLPMHEVCLFCAIRYDFIGHLETFSEEVEYLMSGLTDLSPLPRLPATPPFYKDKFADVRQVPKDVVARILDKYSLDYDFFGYNMTGDFEAVYAQ